MASFLSRLRARRQPPAPPSEPAVRRGPEPQRPCEMCLVFGYPLRPAFAPLDFCVWHLAEGWAEMYAMQRRARP